MRMPAQAETIKRSLPVDVAASVVFVEPVAFRNGEFAFFVVTQSEILKCDLSANVSGRYPFSKIASIERSSEVDAHKLFDQAEYQADVVKYRIHVTVQEASVPGTVSNCIFARHLIRPLKSVCLTVYSPMPIASEITDFYTYCHDSQLYFHMRQAWWHKRLVCCRVLSSHDMIDILLHVSIDISSTRAPP